MIKKRNGKSEFIKNIDEITEKINKGINGVRIYESLNEEGKVSFGYSQFQRYLNSIIGNKDKKTHSEQYKAPKNAINPAPIKNDSFRRKKNVIHDPTMTDERRKELF
ncbi:Hypothetical protein PBPRB1626 [Photobacterium profundum SS9]|uniref:Uncharacterized protein n=2 Tax=Photobacterium profundum TaxID=74109 RepID=Q6LGU4_PHOPR|nr:Hypothetical protein PBPRB1626 [Photobacterium profundum SS9]